MLDNHVLKCVFLPVFCDEGTEIFFESFAILLLFVEAVALSSSAESRKSGISIFVTILKSSDEA